jgi:hypothetical protein
MIEEGLASVQSTNSDQIGQADFFYIDWRKMQLKNLNIVSEDFTKQTLTW